MENERVAILSKSGKLTLVDGPKKVFLWSSKYQYLPFFTANQQEYLIISKRTGEIQHLKGPQGMFLDPREHFGMSVGDLTSVNSGEVVVVYTDENGKVTRSVVRGPASFMLGPNQWLHKFVWHGSDKNNKTRKIPGALKFSQLRSIPDQFYYNVTDVRSKDDALITIKLMVFFELENIEIMLDFTHDPIADFINNVTADIVAYVSQLTYEQFLAKTEGLNELSLYANLLRGAQRIGYKITRVVYRGYFCSDSLQRMHDNSIETRTKLRLEGESEEQKQLIEDMKVNRERERTNVLHALEKERLEHSNMLEQIALEKRLSCEKQEHEEKIKQQQAEHEMLMKQKEEEYAGEVSYLKTLREMNVDLTRYLVATNGSKPTSHMRVDLGGGEDGLTKGSTAPKLHIHQHSDH
eukprot:GCRY01001179.1.p1 GENE.GCRY01001179.1~~GCRY01001179.1.p1  ORF type:complete len:480 (+),score=98.15 GCRY01001179.1:218-1441(+)